jgi:three-Cys-motif partner protein
MHKMGEEYHGREQTWLKHRVLEEYLEVWSHTLGSIENHPVHLWYVDVFAGPWESQSEARADTSIAIGLRALSAAQATWKAKGRDITVHAVFVEKDSRSFKALQTFLESAAGGVDARALHGAFADHVSTIDEMVGRNPAFIFVDPKGWDGVGLRHIAHLLRRQLRDVLINVMYDHLNRFKDDKRDFLRDQMRAFFGLTDADLPPGLNERELMALYRKRLRAAADVPWVADLAVPVPTKERTKFRLVVAGSHPKVVSLFRDVEAKVIGREAAQVRADARARSQEASTSQMALLRPSAPPADSRYAEQHDDDAKAARIRIRERVSSGFDVKFGDLWPPLLCEFHLTLAELRRLVLTMEKEGVLRVLGRKPNQRTVNDDHRIAAPLPPT